MFSVRRVIPRPLDPGRDDGRGRAEAVPGTPEAELAPLTSSVFCELVMTDRAGSKASSVCSPALKSHSTETPARYFSGPATASSVE